MKRLFDFLIRRFVIWLSGIFGSIAYKYHNKEPVVFHDYTVYAFDIGNLGIYKTIWNMGQGVEIQVFYGFTCNPFSSYIEQGVIEYLTILNKDIPIS